MSDKRDNDGVDWLLVRDLTLARMRARYRRTIAGFFWVVLSPVLMYSAQAFVFRHVLQIAVPAYTIFLLGGLLPWIFCASSLEMGIPILQSSRDVLANYKLSPGVLLAASLLDNGLNFLAAFLLVLIPGALINQIGFSGLVFMPLAVAELLLGVGGLLVLLALLNVFYRDVRFVVSFVIGVLYFLTPIFYPIERIPEEYRFWVGLNPIYLMIAPVRDCIYLFSPEKFVASLAKGMVVSLAFVALAWAYWRRRKNEFFYHL